MRRAAFIALALALLAELVHGITGIGSDALFDSWIYTAVEFGGTALCLERAIRVRDERLAWSLLTVYVFLWSVADLVWTVWLNNADVVSYPNISDWLYLGSYSAAYAGQLTLLRARVRPFSTSLWLDGLVVGLGLASLCAAFVFGPLITATEGEFLTVFVTVAYPVADLLLLVFVGLAFGMTGWRPGRAWTLIGISLLLTTVADGYWAYAESAGESDFSALINALWPASILAMGLAAWQPRRRGTVRGDGWEIIAVPALFAVVALGVLFYSQLEPVPFVAAALAIAALLATGIRGGLTFRENVALLHASREEALTDALTGLGNRRRLMQDIDEALAELAADCPRALIFFDLDGFKGYNDAFGHSAGDALLARLGHRLALALGDRGEAYRLGGDEFCVLLRGHAERGDAIISKASLALSEHGDGFAIGASYGVVSLPTDADTATLALQLADERMYAAKEARRGSPRRQARDLLMQILAEREPLLHRHLGDVADLAVRVGRNMRLSSETLDDLARAAELHDIGKVAVPDAVLHKPAALDELEWEMMRQHTVVGERILSAAPALRQVSQLVRSSHERWDGKGYPDALAAEAIPLGARIIAVCDAYDAMTSDRSYRAAMSVDAALAELRRCAGTQFDPAVVAAVIATIQEDSIGVLDIAPAAPATEQRARTRR